MLGPTVAVGAYVLTTLWLFRRLGLVDRHRLPLCACGDQVNGVWFLALAHASLTSGHLSFLTTRVDYPQGINVLDNASMVLLGALSAPVTALVGPVGALALLLRLGFVLSATSAYLVLRRLVGSEVGAAAGGALYGFSPYMVHQGSAHVFLIFVPLPPLMIWLVLDGLGSGRRRAVTDGVVLGLAAAAQYFVCSEILISTALLATLVAALSVIRSRLGRLRPALPIAPAVHLLGPAAAVAAVALAYPAWFALAGPRHVGGPTQPVTSPGISAVSTLVPADRLVLAGLWFKWRTLGLPALADTAYLGVPLLLVMAVVAVTCRHRPIVRAATTFGLVAWVLALGPRLVLHTRARALPLPFALLTHVPILQDLVPSRLTLYVDMAAATLLAVAVAELASHRPRVGWRPRRDPVVGGLGADPRIGLEAAGGEDRRGRARRAIAPPLWLRLAGALVGWSAAVAALAFVLPSRSYPDAGIGPATGFAGGSVAQAVPTGAVVLAYPYPVYPEDEAMLWQAEDGMRFSLLGGYAVRPVAGQGQKAPAQLAPDAVQSFFLGAWPDPQLGGSTRVSEATAAAALPVFVRRYHVTTIVVADAGLHPGRVTALCTLVYGPPRRFGAFDVWTPAPTRR